MTLNELYRDIRAAFEGSLDEAATDRLTVELARFASTVGWAEGVIDKDGRIVSAFEKLREAAQDRFVETRDPNIAALHDALAKLVLAVSTHDEDIDPSPDNEDLDHDS